MIAAHPTRAPSELVKPFLSTLTTYVTAFDSEEKREDGPTPKRQRTENNTSESDSGFSNESNKKDKGKGKEKAVLQEEEIDNQEG